MVVFEVDPKNQLQALLRKYQKLVGDLTIPLKLISQSWFKSNEAIFTLKGPGKYEDFRSQAYKNYKQTLLGSAYPMMMFSGRIRASITGTPGEESINYILDKKNLVLGTSVPYANIHAQGSEKNNLAKRPVVLFGNESVASSIPGVNTRVGSWGKMMLKYCADVTGAK